MSIFEYPLVSVVIPTYNRADLILRAINSVCSQTYQNWEIIVVDDCSEDNTSAIVKEKIMNNSRLRYYCHSDNLGGSAARNTGIEQARGEYVAFLDSDDVWLPQKLELQLKAIAKQCQYNSEIVSYTKFQKSSRVFYQPSVLPHRGKKPGESIADYFWLGGGEILTSTILVSRSLATANPFQTGLPKHQDLDFMMRLGDTNAEFVFLPQVLTIWHNEPRSDRVSRIKNYHLSQDWIESYRDQISERAYKGFLLKEVVPSMLREQENKTKAIELLVEGFWQRIIPIDYFLFLIVKQAISPDLQQSCKRFLQQLKILNNG
ncbi:MAG: glycosyltransferase family 2 protein [Cyanobacteria bacterium P01_G01_bin.19]